MKRKPQVIAFDGVTGSGKSFLLAHLRDEFSKHVSVGSKLTTRQRRIGDNDWEFRFVERIPEQHTAYSFGSVGHQYAIDINELQRSTAKGLVYAISCVDNTTLKELRANFYTVVIYVYRALTEAGIKELLDSRGITSAQPEAQTRREEMASICRQYISKIELYDHTILNVGSLKDVKEQLSKVLFLHGISPNTSTEDINH